MEGYAKPFEGKKITLMGLGLLGRGVGDAAFLAQCGAQLIVTDKKTEIELAESVAQLKDYPNIEFHLGGHRLEDFQHADMVIKAAGIPLDSPEIAAAHAAGVLVYMSTALFANYAMEEGAKVIGVTGTRGKTTTTSMIYHAVKTTGRRVHVGGNIRGKSTLAMLPEIEKGDIVVLELDSWQLQGFGDLHVSPHIAIFTNLMPDHMNYYGNDMNTYFSDKANIFRFQKSGDILLIGKAILDRVEAARPAVAPQIPSAIPPEWKLSVIGEHNRDNAAFAASALRALNLSDTEIRQGIESFAGVEGRLQFVGEIRGVKIYNDNNATTPEATVAALRALGSGIALIVGGSEKNLDLKELVAEIQGRTSRVVLLVHENYAGSVRLAEALKKTGVLFQEARTLPEALKIALSGTEQSILFSPGFASFGMFKNEYDRNDTFMGLITEL
jgi:UDP-N-acetylmuramoylalanine--D-glutamate ligase